MATNLNYQTSLKINDFSSSNAIYKPLDKSVTSTLALTNLFMFNNNSATYGDGSHATLERVANKINIWGTRENNGDYLKCFLVYDNSNAYQPIQPAGFVNFGLSYNTKINNISVHEGGALFDYRYNNNASFVAESLNSVYIDYPTKLYNRDDLGEAPAFIYTVSSNNPLYQALKLSQLHHFAHSADQLLEDNCILQALSSNQDRFVVTGTDILDDGRLVELFYHFYDKSICPETAIEITASGLTQ